MAARTCGVCGVTAPPYTCPRCSGPFCSAPCYAGHNGGVCSAARAHSELSGALRDERAQPDTVQRTAAALEGERRAREEDEEEAALLAALEAADREDFSPSMVPWHIREQFERDLREGRVRLDEA